MGVHPAIVLVGGLVVIVLGAEMLLRGATRVAALLGVSPLLIGLTVVAIGTSTPELAVGITAAVEGNGPLAVANIAGTNIVNILLILGLSAAIRPLPLHLLSVRLDLPVMIAAALALLVMASDRMLSRTEGVLLLLGAAAYLFVLVRLSRSESRAMRKEFAEEYSSSALLTGPVVRSWAWNGLLLAAGIALSIIGADLLVAGATRIARTLGVSDAIIGLTIVAIGTSAPELGTTLVATLKDERDVAIGNLIGSSITNILVILGLTCIAAPDGVGVSREILRFDLPISAAVAIACLPVFRSGREVSRGEGIAFVSAYLIYLATLIFVRA